MRSRFAPSPTGFLHIGGARTGLFSWLQAKAAGGQYILRVEDTDTERNSAAATEAIIEAMNWLGLDCDEGPFYQSQRLELYKKHVDQLLAEGKAYYCECSKERLDDMREAQMQAKEKPRYDGRCRDLGLSGESKNGVKPVVRFRNPQQGEVSWKDQVRDEVVISNSELDDLIIWRSDDTPTYNFCVVVDDSDMKITHVLRGEDHINNTPRQINLYEALGKEVPVFAHVPMILGSDGAKLSKRHGALNVMEYKQAGFLPEALVNYLVRLGWSHGDQEIFEMADLIQHFNADDINKAPSAFNPEKLAWLNQHWMKQYSLGKLLQTCKETYPDNALWNMADAELQSAMSLFRERTDTLIAMLEEMAFLVPDSALQMDDAAAEMIASEQSKSLLAQLIQGLEAADDWNAADLDALCKQTAVDAGVKLGALGPAIRIAITGKKQAPSLGDLLVVTGKDLAMARLRAVVV